MGCEENAYIDGYKESEGYNQAFTKVYWNYFYRDPNEPQGFSTSLYGRATYLKDAYNDFIIAKTKDGKKNIKEYSKMFSFLPVNTQNGKVMDYSVGAYFLCNYKSLNAFIENVIYSDYYEDDRDEQIALAKEKLPQWFGSMSSNPSSNDCIEPVFIYAYDAVFVSTYPVSEDYHNVISPLFYMSCTTPNSAYTLIMNKNTVPLYLYDDVITQDNPAQFSQGDLYLTTKVIQYYPNY